MAGHARVRARPALPSLMRAKESKARFVRFPASPRVFIVGCTLLVVSVQYLLSRRAHSQQQLQASGRSESVSAAPSPRQGCPMMRPQFVLFGDSITQHGFNDGGWCARLAHDYSRKVRFCSARLLAASQPCSVRPDLSDDKSCAVW